MFQWLNLDGTTFSPKFNDSIWKTNLDFKYSFTSSCWLSPSFRDQIFCLVTLQINSKTIAKWDKLDVSFSQEYGLLTKIHNMDTFFAANYIESSPKLYLIKYDETVKFWPTPLYKLLQTGPTFLWRCYETAVCWKNNPLPDANRLWVKLRIR